MQSTLQPKLNPRPEETARPEPPPLLLELTPEQFNQWRRHPVSALILEQWLPECQRRSEVDLLNIVMGGNTNPAALSNVRGELLACLLLQTMTLDKIRAAYGLLGWAEARKDDPR